MNADHSDDAWRSGTRKYPLACPDSAAMPVNQGSSSPKPLTVYECRRISASSSSDDFPLSPRSAFSPRIASQATVSSRLVAAESRGRTDRAGRFAPGTHVVTSDATAIHGNMSDLIDLADLSVIVTGASSGIGASTARLLHAVGAHPVLAARRGDRLAALSKELGGALAVPTDVTDQEQVRALAAATLGRHGRIDGLVNNAGTGLNGPLDRVDPAAFCKVLQLNVVGLVTMTQAVLPAMRRQGFGRIVNVSSGATRRVAVGFGAYASTKSAVNMLSGVFREELAGDGIAVSLLLPSITATEFGDGMFTLGASPRPGMLVQSPDYVAGIVLRMLRTGEESFDIPHGPEQPGLAQPPR